METNILTIPTHHYFVYFILFSSIVVILSVMVFSLLSSKQYRRAEFSSLGTYSKQTSLIMVLPFALLSLRYFYHDSWGYFYRLDTNDYTIRITYAFPERTRYISRDETFTIHTLSEMRKTGVRYRLVMTDSYGVEHRSQLLTRTQIANVAETIKQLLHMEIED